MVNCYIVADEESGRAAVFDPAGDAEKILETLKEKNLEVSYIVNTHAHWDHVGGNDGLQQATGAPVLIHREEAPGLQNVSARAAVYGKMSENSEASRFIEEGDILEVGALRFEVMDLRGHSPGGLGFAFEGEIELEGVRQKRSFVICGDALFAGSIGRTDLPGGDMDLLLDNIRKKLLSLRDDTIILPGHGPVTTVQRERTSNPFLQT